MVGVEDRERDRVRARQPVDEGDGEQSWFRDPV